MAWNFGDILDTIIPVLPDNHLALVHGDREITWAQMSSRSNNLGRFMLENGADIGDKVGFYMRNRPEYMETLAACFRARLTHVNVNYRYVADEVHYIFDNSDAAVVVYGKEFRDNVEILRPRLPNVKLWIEVGDGAGLPADTLDYEQLTATGNGENLDIAREGNDLLFLYTGGTTGMPKGVMWEHDALRETQTMALRALGDVPETLDELKAHLQANGPGEVYIPACPLMHGTGLFTAMAAMMNGGHDCNAGCGVAGCG